jgi:hypothetical protein
MKNKSFPLLRDRALAPALGLHCRYRAAKKLSCRRKPVIVSSEDSPPRLQGCPAQGICQFRRDRPAHCATSNPTRVRPPSQPSPPAPPEIRSSLSPRAAAGTRLIAGAERPAATRARTDARIRSSQTPGREHAPTRLRQRQSKHQSPRDHSMNIYVGNLPYSVTDSDLRETFTQYGSVDQVNLITDKFSGESKGFGFVEMANNAEADAAIKALNGTDYQGRNITVNQAKPKSDRPRGGGGGRRW